MSLGRFLGSFTAGNFNSTGGLGWVKAEKVWETNLRLEEWV